MHAMNMEYVAKVNSIVLQCCSSGGPAFSCCKGNVATVEPRVCVVSNTALILGLRFDNHLKKSCSILVEVSE